MTFVPFFRPSIGDAEEAEVLDTLRSGWLTTGKKAAKFEIDFASFLQVPHAIAVNSATSGLHLALEALGVRAGDKIITTPYTFTATAEVIRYLGADPLFVDIDPQTLNIDPEKIKNALLEHSGVKGIIPVHFAGQSCDMRKILDIAYSNGLWVVEDAAHALPTTHGGQTIGTLADVTVFSFYATKTITTGEGGMAVTLRDDLAQRMRTMRLHGINRDAFSRYAEPGASWYYEVVAPGFKYNMMDLSAALGIVQLRRVHEFQKARENIAKKYTEGLSGLPLRVPTIANPNDTHAWHLYVIQLELERLSIDRNRFIEMLAKAGIGSSVHFIPLHIQPYWRDTYRLDPDDYPKALESYRRSVSLPLFPSMTSVETERVISAVQSILLETEVRL